MMNVIEIAIIGSQKTDKEMLFSLLSDKPLRNFQGLKFGELNLDKDKSIYYYFLNQEKESYVWDLIIPHSVAVIVVCDFDYPQILNENLLVIERLENSYTTPYFICPFQSKENIIEEMEKYGIDIKNDNRILEFDHKDRGNAKKVLTNVLTAVANE
jgi:hypothetical protein